MIKDERRKVDLRGSDMFCGGAFAEMVARVTLHSSEEKRLDLIATKSRPSLHSRHVLSLTEHTIPHLALRGCLYITFSMAARRVFRTLQTRFARMASQSKNSSTLEEQEQKSAGTFDNDVPAIDKVKERQLVRKLDLYIVPVVMLLYLFSFLDRSVSAFFVARTLN
jgi:hypothetical protein